MFVFCIILLLLMIFCGALVVVNTVRNWPGEYFRHVYILIIILVWPASGEISQPLLHYSACRLSRTFVTVHDAASYNIPPVVETFTYARYILLYARTPPARHHARNERGTAPEANQRGVHRRSGGRDLDEKVL